MQIFTRKDGQQYGPYTLEQVKEMLGRQQLSLNDLAWYDGAPQWTVLRSVPGVSDQPQPSFQPAKQSQTWKVVAGVAALLGLVGIIGAIQEMVDPPKKNEVAVAKPAATATPEPTPTPMLPADALAQAKGALNGGEPSVERLRRGVGYLKEIPAEAKETKEAQVMLKKYEPQLAAAESDEVGLGTQPVNSALDGKVLEVDRYLSKTLNDYDSSEYLEWSPVVRTKVKGVSFWTVRLKLRAKNSFGAYIVKDTYYFIRGGEVVAAEGL